MSKRTSLFVSGGDLCRPECRLKEGEESVVSRSSAVAQQKGCNAHASPQNNSTKTFLSVQLFYMSRNPVIEFEVYHPGKVWPTLTIVRKEPCLSKVQGGLCCRPPTQMVGELESKSRERRSSEIIIITKIVSVPDIHNLF